MAGDVAWGLHGIGVELSNNNLTAEITARFAKADWKYTPPDGAYGF